MEIVALFARLAVCCSMMTYMGCAAEHRSAPLPDSEPITTTARQARAAMDEKPADSPKPFEHEGDTEYANGLAAMLKWSSLVGGPKVIITGFASATSPDWRRLASTSSSPTACSAATDVAPVLP
jgi:hypothetical protein